MKLGLCEKCGKPADACYEIRDNRVYLVKFCHDCGRTSSLVTRDARKWRWKREIAGYTEPTVQECSMDCASCDHQAHTKPTTVAVDVTLTAFYTRRGGSGGVCEPTARTVAKLMLHSSRLTCRPT